MNHQCESPWVARFQNLQDVEIADQLSNTPSRISRDDYDTDESFLGDLKSGFEELFVPTLQSIKYARQIVESCPSYAAKAYRDGRDFLRQSYAEDGPDSCGENFPICFTGPAGIGKSSLLKRLHTILPAPSSICVDSGHRAFPLNAMWFLSIEEMTSVVEMLKSLISTNGGVPSARTIDGLVKQCRRLAYQSGVCLLALDEIQSLSKTVGANARIASTLLTFRRIGIPIVYGANYSLVHRLESRDHQDIERLLSDPIILVPDTADSVDWMKTVEGFTQVSPALFQADISSASISLHSLTAGSRRLLSFLLREAAKHCLRRSESVCINDIRAAYESTTFAANRKNVELMNLQFATGKMERSDLWCPFDLPLSTQADLTQSTKDVNMQQITEDMLYTSMTPGQQAVYDAVSEAAAGAGKSKVVAIGAKASPSLEDFERGASILKSLDRKT